MLNLEGCVVTVDALNCQREIARQVIDRKGDYALALKSLPRRRPIGAKIFLRRGIR